jgi:hypothetical protein
MIQAPDFKGFLILGWHPLESAGILKHWILMASDVAGIPHFWSTLKVRVYSASAGFCFGVIPLRDILGR